MTGEFNESIYTDDWTNKPLHMLLYEWFIKNMTLPTDMSNIIAYLGLFLIIWYALIWATRFIISIIWPLFLLLSAIIVFRILQFYDPEDIRIIFINVYNIVKDTLMFIVTKLFQFILNLIDF